MAFPKVKLSDDSGNTVDVTSNALHVKLADSDDIDIGNVVLTSASGSNIWAETADTDSDPNLNDRLLLGTHALLSARLDASTTIGITALDGTHNALHVALTSGEKYATAIDLDEQEAAPAIVNVGGEYRATKVLYQDGDAAILQTDRNGHLNIAGSHIDDGDFTLGTSRGVAIMGFQGTQSITTDDVGVLACTTGGFLKVSIAAISTSVLTTSEGTLGAGGYAYSEGNSTGCLVGAVRNDVLEHLADDNERAPFQVSDTGALYTTHGITGGADGITTDDTTGQVLGGDVACKKIDIQALTDNTGLIAVGFTGVDATEATGTGIILYAGDVYSLEINNLNLIYIESTVDTDGVRYTYFT